MERCARHPNQFFTGFCSSCLAERLCHVDSHPEIIEAPSYIESERNGTEIRARTTLLSLFQLDDDFKKTHGGGCSEEDGLSKKRSKTPSFRSNSKGFRWGSRCGSKSGRFADDELGEGNHDSDWEKPRHSWDGSMMSKALACSFTCLDEPLEGSRRNVNVGRRVPEETVVVSSSEGGMIGAIKVEEKLSAREGSSSVEVVSRKKSLRWSRVWDWSITSPFREFGKKKEQKLERSLSESWQESRKEKNVVGLNGNGVNLSRNVNGGNGEIQKFRPEWQRKREYRFGRSRSVHYPSPRNVDNGLLRFYLTPMRSSIRSSGRGRMRTSRFFAKGILGI